MENRGSADDGDVVFKDSSADGIKDDAFAEEFPSDFPSIAMSSAPDGHHPYPSFRLPSASKGDDYESGTKILEHVPPGEPPFASFNRKTDRDLTHGSASGTKRLEHAPPGEPMPSPGLRMVDSLERDQVGFASNHNVAPGAFPVPSRNTVQTRTFRSPISSYDSTRELANEESKQEDEVSNSAGAYPSAHDSNRMAAESGLCTVEAQRVQDANEEGTVMVADSKYVRMKWYQRPLYRWTFFGSILFACGLLGAVVVFIVRSQAAASGSSLMPPTTVPITVAPTLPEPTATPLAPIPITAPPTRARPRPPTSKPTSLAPVAIACNFLSIPNVSRCRSTFEFSGTTIGSTIPSEIGLLTQLTWLDSRYNSLQGSIPSEIGLLTQLTYLSFYINSLNSTMPSEIGLLTKLTYLDFSNNALTSTIPSEMGLLTQLTVWSFSSNSLTSTIPSEMGLLTLLTYLFFFSNDLKGTIPSSLCSLPSLYSNIYIDCGEISCASGCCAGFVTLSPCV